MQPLHPELEEEIVGVRDAVFARTGVMPDLLRVSPDVYTKLLLPGMDNLNRFFGMRVQIEPFFPRNTFIVMEDIESEEKRAK